MSDCSRCNFLEKVNTLEQEKNNVYKDVLRKVSRLITDSKCLSTNNKIQLLDEIWSKQ